MIDTTVLMRSSVAFALTMLAALRAGLPATIVAQSSDDSTLSALMVSP